MKNWPQSRDSWLITPLSSFILWAQILTGHQAKSFIFRCLPFAASWCRQIRGNVLYRLSQYMILRISFSVNGLVVIIKGSAGRLELFWTMVAIIMCIYTNISMRISNETKTQFFDNRNVPLTPSFTQHRSSHFTRDLVIMYAFIQWAYFASLCEKIYWLTIARHHLDIDRSNGFKERARTEERRIEQLRV